MELRLICSVYSVLFYIFICLLACAIAFQSAQDIALQFATVARDGRITQDELPAVRTIRAKAVELRRIMEETIAAIDKATSGQTKD